MESHTSGIKRKTHNPTPRKGPSTNLPIIFSTFHPNPSPNYVSKLQVKILVNGEERISPWASYVLQPPRENQVYNHFVCVRVNFYILKGFEGTAFAQHMWSPAEDVKRKLLHPRPSKPSSLRCFHWPFLPSQVPQPTWYFQGDPVYSYQDLLMISTPSPGCTSAMWAFQARRAKSTPIRISLVLSFPE